MSPITLSRGAGSGVQDQAALVEWLDLDGEGSAAADLTQTALNGAREIMGVALDALPAALLFHSTQGILFANAESGRLLGLQPDALVGQHLLDFVYAGDVKAVSGATEIALADCEQRTTVEALLSTEKGQRLCRMTIARLPWPGNPIAQLVISDITDQRRAEASLRQLTITDELTGAYNRRHAFYEGSLYADAFRTDGAQFTVAAIDIDHFKQVNDTFGHAAGDRALQALTDKCHALLPTIRRSDSAMFARIGGEEFVLLLPGLDCPTARAECDLLRKQVEEMCIVVGNSALRLTISIGVAQMTTDDRSFDGLLERADAALYCAKHTGRNRVESANNC